MTNVLKEESLGIVSAVSMGLLNTAKMYVSTGLSFINGIKDKYYLKGEQFVDFLKIYIDKTIESSFEIYPQRLKVNEKWNANLVHNKDNQWLEKTNESLVDIGMTGNKKNF